MSHLDKERIEGRFGPLWSGKTEISLGGRIRTLVDIKRSFDLTGEDVLSIDLHELPGGTYAFRFYDGDDRCVAVFVFNGEWDILEEHRAHIGEWLEGLYHETGALAFDPEAMLHILRRKVTEGRDVPGEEAASLACRKTSVRESAAQWNLDALVEFDGGELLPCFVSVVSTYCTVQASNTKDGETLLGKVARALGTPPSSPPQVVKGGSCGGEEEDAEFPFTGSMVSATWEYPRERKEIVLSAFRGLFGLGEGASG